MKNIETILKKTLKEKETVFKNNPTIESYEKASENFEELVKKGWAKKRGYNLSTISDWNKMPLPVLNKPNK